MRKAVLLSIMVLAGVLGIRAQRTWVEPSPSAYASHAVVYAAFVDKQGKPVEVRDCMVGAFIDDQCRAIATKSTVQGVNSTSVVYTFRIGVKDEDAGKTVKFYLKQSNAQIDFELAETLTVSGGDETIGGTPSNPFNLTFVPVTGLDINNESLTVQVGEEVTQYLRHMVSPSPQDATFKEEALIFYTSQDETALATHDDGTITAEQTGSGVVNIRYEGINSVSNEITVIVVDPVPTADKYVIASNPLTIELADYELAKVNILSRLNDNVTTTLKNPVFPDQFYMVEGPNVAKKILTFSYNADTNKATEVLANEYGSTRVEWTYRIDAAGFNSDGSFNPRKEYSVTFGFDVNIVRGLTSISLPEMVEIGVGDANPTIKIETVPENLLLDESAIKWGIETNAFTIGERIAGTNEWKINVLGLAQGVVLNVYYNQLKASTGVSIQQRVNIDEGWHWFTLFAGQGDITLEEGISIGFGEAQEIRSQTQLLYNDPNYGFFGELKGMSWLDTYKINVKTGQTINYLIPGIDNYMQDEVTKYYSPGWNWSGFPYCFNHSVSQIFAKSELADGTRIVSKNDGFTELNSGKWAGTLQTIKAGEGYLVYYPGSSNVNVILPAEGLLKRVNNVPSIKRAPAQNIWNYDASRFADNMTIIARSDEELDADRYSIGAFVAGECRGEGKIIDGRIFITVHGENGEKVNFKLHDNLTGEYRDLAERVDFADMRGTFKSPMHFDTDGSAQGIQDVISDSEIDPEAEIYTISGQRVNSQNLAKGIYIVRTKTATRKLIKK
mgnify:CR=1 FL=1